MAVAEVVINHFHSYQIFIRTDRQKACRCFRDNDLPSHVHACLQQFLHAHPHLQIMIERVPGHQSPRGNSSAHEVPRAKFTPGPSTFWPEPYDPREHRRQMHKELTALMLDLRQGTTTLRSLSHRFSRLDASLIRRVQTQSLVAPPYTYHIQGTWDQPTCPGYRTSTHVSWDCPTAQSSLQRILLSLPTQDGPGAGVTGSPPPGRGSPHYGHSLSDMSATCWARSGNRRKKTRDLAIKNVYLYL